MTVNTAYAADDARRAAIATAIDQAGGRGKVISVKPYKDKDGTAGYSVRILTDGRVKTFQIPAEAQ